jgi:hypothetical protein
VFEFLIVPPTSDEQFDRDWMAETGLTDWLERQRAQGCRILSVGTAIGGGEPVDETVLDDFRALSPVLGRRLPSPEPSDAELDALAVWLESIAGAKRLRERCFGS